MANFKTHLSVASIASTGVALVLVDVQLTTAVNALSLMACGATGGILPDIDASRSKPAKLLFVVLGIVAAVSTFQAIQYRFPLYVLVLLAMLAFLAVRYGLFALFNTFTVHRGVFHSVLATLFFTLLTICVSYYFLKTTALMAWLNGCFVAGGSMIHLLLDEWYSVDLANRQLKKSWGTALKLYNYNAVGASLLMAVLTVVLYGFAPSPKTFIEACRVIDWLGYYKSVSHLFVKW